VPIDEIDKKRPICDTDIWIKDCKYKELYKEELIFDMYDNIFMSDAVCQELGREREDKEPFNSLMSPEVLKRLGHERGYEDPFKEDFELGLNHLSTEKGNRLSIIRSFDEKLFDEDKIRALDRDFLANGIYYDQKENRYIGTKKGLGEKVTLIIAAILDILIILSDDGHTRDGAKAMINQYPYLEVINLHSLLMKKYKNYSKVKEIKDIVNKPINESKTGLAEIAISSVSNSKPNLKSYRNKFRK
jgi:hypothetical protein